MYQMLSRVEQKIDDLSQSIFQTFVPRTEIDERFRNLQDQHDRLVRAVKWSIGTLIAVLGVAATVITQMIH